MVLLLCVCMLVRVWERPARGLGEGPSVGGVGAVSAGRAVLAQLGASSASVCVCVCARVRARVRVDGPRIGCVRVCVRVCVCVSMVRVSAV